MTEHAKRHCDDILDSGDAPECVLAFLRVARAPAHGGGRPYPSLFAALKEAAEGRGWTGDRNKDGEPVMFGVPMPAGTRVRVVMASRFGDVGITPTLEAEHGYILRLMLDDLTDFGAQP